MNSKIKNLMLSKDEKALNIIKKEFILIEKKFEDIKELFILNDNDDLLDKLLIDLHNHKSIRENLNILFNNEKEIEIEFDKLFILQKEKIKYEQLFNSLYSIEKKLRKNLEKKITKIKNIQTMSTFGYLQYYSKETLYQHKNEQSLNLWIKQIDLLYLNHDIADLKKYRKIVKQIGSYILHINSIMKKEQELQNSILSIIERNKQINVNIEKDIEKLATDFINKIYISLFILILITVFLIVIFGRIVYQNVGLSVDEIEHEVDKGLDQINQLNTEITNTQKEVVFTMGAIGETRSKETGNHVKRVAEYSKVLALHYGLPPYYAEMLKQASPMHDIGKVGIPDSILNKPGRFNEEERKIMDTHATLGYEMLKMSTRPLLQLAATVAYEHHEKWDGTGYPQGLKDDAIDIAGRITALADVFDALGSNRVYKKAWDDERIFNLFKEERGKHFDPKLIDIFFENLEDFLTIRDKFKDAYI